LVGVGALATTAFACVLIIIQMFFDGLNDIEPVPHRPHDFMEFFLAFGIILFAFGGASTFPTIQNDMNDKSKFSKSVSIGFLGKISLNYCYIDLNIEQ
jgi:vesicular inhibitory amino acid transporter